MTKRRKRAKKSSVAKKAKPAKKARIVKRAKAAKVATRRPSNVKKRGVKPARSKKHTKRGASRKRHPKAVSTNPRRVQTGFERGPAYVGVRKKLGREPTKRELEPTTRDYAIVDVLVQALKWQGRATPLMDAKAFITMREALSPAGDMLLQKRSEQYMSRQTEAEKRAERAYRNGTLDREYIRIAKETGLTPREVYSLGISPPSMGIAA